MNRLRLLQPEAHIHLAVLVPLHGWRSASRARSQREGKRAADPVDLSRLLCFRRERRGQEAGSRHDEGSAIHHWMIPERGMVSPSALAV